MNKIIKDFENYTVNDSGDNEKTVFSSYKGRYKKPQKFKNGYLFVTLFNKGVTKIFLLHRLIAEAFIPNPENKPCIDHINGIKSDNRVDNLRWVTYKENMNNPITRKRCINNRKGKKHSEETKLKLSECGKKRTGEKNHFFGKRHSEETKKKISEANKKWVRSEEHIKALLEGAKKRINSIKKIVYQYTLEGELVGVYESTSEAARQNGYSQQHVSACCRGERKTHKRYIWSYTKK